jgi:hypothetical protein
MVAEAANDEKLTQLAQRYVNDNSGLRMRSRNLQRSTNVTAVRTRAGALIKVSNTAAYAWAQDQGSGLYGRKRDRYRIPRADNLSAKTLVFMWKGKLTFRKWVKHPGVRPTRFLYNTTDALGRLTAHYLRARMAVIAKKF